jgi:hypothetical protein
MPSGKHGDLGRRVKRRLRIYPESMKLQRREQIAGLAVVHVLGYCLSDRRNSSFRCAQTRNEALDYCCELLAPGAELRSITNDAKNSKESLRLRSKTSSGIRR